EAISAIHRRNRVPIVVGGTGFYLRALLDGLSPAPSRNPAVRLRLTNVAARRPGVLHRFLRARDPEAANRIHFNDRQKLIRAIELILLARQPVTTIQSLPRDALRGVRALKFGLIPPRAVLYQHLDRRSAQMFSNGLLTETKALLDSGVSPFPKPLQSLGYKQAADVLTRRSQIGDAIRECQAKTRQYAKRQMTWFRAEAGVHWLRGFGADNAIKEEAIKATEKFLQSF
ncbi:MAG: tRNA dimethylallyltransferase, partial [Bryobacteraceae bacterium]